MSQSVTSQVLGALNGAVIASIPTINGSPIKPAKREDGKRVLNSLKYSVLVHTLINIAISNHSHIYS